MASIKERFTARRKKKSNAKAGSKRPVGKAIDAAALKFCEQPVVPVREFSLEVGPERASLIRNSDRKWANGTKLRYHFLTSPVGLVGSGADRQKVRDGFRAWRISASVWTSKKSSCWTKLRSELDSSVTVDTGPTLGETFSVSPSRIAR